MGQVTMPTPGTVVKQTVRQKLNSLFQIVLLLPADKLAIYLHVFKQNVGISHTLMSQMLLSHIIINFLLNIFLSDVDLW